jgi:hypothetical protein
MNQILKKGLSGNQSILQRLLWHDEAQMGKHWHTSAKILLAKHHWPTLLHWNSFCGKHSQAPRSHHLN